VGDHILEERVRTYGEVGRVGQGKNVLDVARGKSISLPEGGVVQMLAKSFKELGTANFVVREDLPQALDRT